MEFNDLGLMSYERALALQLEAVKENIHGGCEQVFLLEHYPVVTLGRNHSRKNLLVNEDYLRINGIQLVNTTRGGDITCHFPGQLVVYPVMKIEKRPGGIRTFFNSLEQSVINLLHIYGLRAHRSAAGAGVYTANGKIASMGIAVKKWVSCHGIALNLEKDLSLFEIINPCGSKDIRMTSVHRECGVEYPDMAAFKHDFCREFIKVFA